jgi:predicted dehydrogenase
MVRTVASLIHIGVIGTGAMGREHIRNIKAFPGAVVYAIYDPDPASLKLARQAVSPDDVPTYHDLDGLLAREELDAIIIATPNATHADVLGRVFEARPDIAALVEKPLAQNTQECRRICSMARTGMVWVGLEYRYMPEVASWLKDVRAGAIGDPRMVFVREHRFPFKTKVGNWNRFSELTGGTLVEKSCHHFDLMRIVAAADPVRVYASGAQDVNHLREIYDGRRPNIIDNAFVIVDFANGVRGCLDLCMFVPGREDQEFSVVGTRGKLAASVDVATRAGDPDQWGTHVVEVTTGVTVIYEGLGGHHGASYRELVAFCAAVRSGEPPGVDVSAGLWSVAMGEAGERSIRECRPVLMNELGL